MLESGQVAMIRSYRDVSVSGFGLLRRFSNIQKTADVGRK